MCKIYHYTTLENLVLILKNKTIRFNRLDRMDDPCEHKFFSFKMNWSPYTYVSCWTESMEENIPLWHMYSKGGVGVRLSIDRDCIDWDNKIIRGYRQLDQEINPPERKGQGSVSVAIRPFAIYSPLSTKECYHKINYIDNSKIDCPVIIGANKITVERTLTENDFTEYIGLYKDKKWEFQDEYRFRVFLIPQIPEKKNFNEVFLKTIENQVSNPFPYMDFPIKEECLNNLKVKVGPNATESHYLILEAIRNLYRPSLKIEPSELNSENWKFVPQKDN